MNKDIINIINETKSNKANALDLSGLGLTYIPEEIFNLHDLIELNLSNNEIEIVPSQISRLANLKHINIEGNPIKNVPYEVIKLGIGAITTFFERHERIDAASQISEAKLLLVGEGGVGKTTFKRRLIDRNAPLPNIEDSTHGIEIAQFKFDTEDNKIFTINVWDFGGQEIYHGTHQLFLTRHSLYALIIDSRREDNNLNYWLNAIESVGENSPLLIIVNEKHDRSVNIDEVSIKSRFPNIVKILRSNFLTERGLSEVIEEIKHQIQNLSHIGTLLPISWTKIRVEIEEISKKYNYISIENYLDICIKHNLSDKRDALMLIQYFHDLGILFHFPNNSLLRRIVILNPQWLVTPIYMVIDDYAIREQRGQFNKKNLSKIWEVAEEYSNVEDEILEIMFEFELCYRFDKDTFIIPQLLPYDKPTIEWDSLNTLTIKYFYLFMPKGILNRLIVRMNHYIHNNLVWNSGVLLKRQESFALIEQEYWKNEITVSVKGSTSKELLTIILENIDSINSSFKSNVQTKKMIPCTCTFCSQIGVPHFYNFDNLNKRLEHGIQVIQCENSYEEVSVRQLLGLIEHSLITENQILTNTLSKFGINANIFIEKGGEDEK